MTQFKNPIKVIGVGGGGSNAVNTMHERGIQGVDFIVCNTDAQALEASQVETKVQLGRTLTEGQGAGSQPEVGKNAAIESLDEITELLNKGTRMVFVTAGMGGGTGTGAAPVIAKAARDLGILTVGIVTIPFKFEGRRRADQAEIGLAAMRDAVDTLLIIRNDKLRELYSGLTIRKAFMNADEVLCTAAKGIAEVITLTGQINVDMNDVNTVMRDSGRAIMGSGRGSGEGRAEKAVKEALESPLLNDHDITGAHFVLLNITFSKDEILMDEVMEITDFIQEAAGQTAEVIWGYGIDPSLEEDISVTVIATGFNALDSGTSAAQVAEKKLWLGGGLPPQTEATAQPLPTRTHDESETPYIKPVEPISGSSWNAPLQQGHMEIPKPPVSQPIHIDGTLWTLKEVPSEPIEQPTSAVTPTLFSPTEHEEAPMPEEPRNGFLEDSLTETELETGVEFEADMELDMVADLEVDTPSESKNETEETIRFTLSLDEDEAPAPPVRSANDANNKLSGFTIHQAPSMEESSRTNTPSPALDIQARQAERNKHLKEFTHKMKTPHGLADLENEPAYKRRKVMLEDVTPSNAATVGRYTLNTEVDEEGNEHTSITQNGFLSDQVD